MTLRRLFLFGLFFVLAGPVRADEDELPSDARRLVEENQKASDEILKKADDLLRKAQEAKQKADDEVQERKQKLIAKLDELAKRLAKEGKTNQAKIVAEQVEELKTGRIAGAMPDPGTVGGLRGQNGKVFLFEVTGAQNGSVWGSDTYTDDSSLATAAVHAGVLQVGQKGVVKVTILPGQQSYTGSTRNGVSTGNWDAWHGSFKVEPARGKRLRGAAPRPAPMADPGTLVNFRGQNGKTFLVEITGQNTGPVWGTGIYTDDSSLATAAVHAGLVKVGQKAVVKVMILPGEPQYTGSESNGITSSDYGEWQGSYQIEAVKK